MAKRTKKGAVGATATKAEVQELVAKKGQLSRSQKRLARKLDGAKVFRGEGAKDAARAARTKLRRAGKKVSYARLNVGGEIVFAVKEQG